MASASTKGSPRPNVRQVNETMLPTHSLKKKGPAPLAPGQKSATPAVSRTKESKADMNRPCAEHNFLTDVADVRQMEKGLLLLLGDFHKGKLQVFGKDCTLEQMDQVRERQERLSRLHFDLDAQQQMYEPDSDDAKELAFKNLNKLVENLEDLNNAVHELKSGAVSPKSVTIQLTKGKGKGEAKTSDTDS